jgi:hypothetical protein
MTRIRPRSFAARRTRPIPPTSTVSECRPSGPGSILAVVTWAYARYVLLGHLEVSCIYTCGPRRSRAVVGPSLGPWTPRLRGLGPGAHRRISVQATAAAKTDALNPRIKRQAHRRGKPSKSVRSFGLAWPFVLTAVYQDPVPSDGVAALTNRPLASEYVWMDRRSYWFDEGASALRLVLERQGRGHQLPSADDYYACPCCLGVYPREAVAARALTIEDVPPKVLGGRPMLLTCGKCNSSSGTNFDAHAAQKAIADAFVRGDVTPKVRATSYIDGIPLRGTAQSTEDGISLVSVPKQNDPKVEAAYMRAMDSLAKEGGVSPQFSFTVHTRFDEARASPQICTASGSRPLRRST